MSDQQNTPEECRHPRRGRQERELGMGTGDYFCSSCDTPMPIQRKAPHCRDCGVDHVPEPQHGQCWRCPGCGSSWAWMPSDMRA